MSMLGFETKTPGEVLDYDIDFTAWLGDSETVVDATAVVDLVEEVGIVISSVTAFSQIVKVWVQGGVSGHTYEIRISATTSGDRVKEECFKIRVKDC